MEKEIETIQNIVNTASEFAVAYGFQVLGALIILTVGWYVGKWTGGFVLRLCEKARLDITLAKFFSNVAKFIVLGFVLVIALGKFGITIAPFIAAIGAVAFGSTLALQGPLSNYGAGITIILSRPFVVGDTIKLQNVFGVVEDIKLAYTQLSNEDGELITIPNKHIVGEIIHNSFKNLVVESKIGISYSSNTDEAIKLIKDVLTNCESVVSEPAPQVGILNFADSAVEISYRYWVPAKEYYQTVYSVNAEVFKSFKQNGIVIPYPQQEITILGNPA